MHNIYREEALRLHGLGANVVAIGSDQPKKVAHSWKAFQTARQTIGQVEQLPWEGYFKGDGTRVDVTGCGVVSGPNGWRAYDFDRAPTLSR